MLHIHTSNRLESLAQDCATIIKENPQPPLIREIIVVQNQGMARWLSMSLAEKLGVFAHGHFPFPDALLWQVFKAVLELPDISQFERDVMLWSLMDILQKILENQEFMEINAYLQDDDQEIKRFQLAWRLANVFDQYVVYRPDWLADWENEKQPESLKNDSQARWQAILWRALIARFGTAHRAKLRAAFFSKAENLANNPRFQRISIFGISALPPFHLDVLAGLGKVVEVHVFLLNPCKEYWGRIVSDGEMAYQTGNQSIAPETLYFEKGNTLLASLGRMGRDFIDMLNEYPHVNHDYFDEPGEETLLACLQSDILHLKERGTPTPIDFDDKSLQIHTCHSPMREVEVLHDQLLALFEENPKLLPKDVIVMMPDIETYAPLIEAVFATAQRAKKMPFSIADRNLRGESALVNTFFAILELSKSRFSVSEVLGVLETEAVQKRFGLSEQDLDLIRHWIEKTGIRWGMNKADRVHKNLPAFEENTWWAGLKRLLLGYALPGGGEKMFNEILPYDGIEGSDALILGKLVTFVEKLFESVQALAKPRILSEWLKFLTQILEDFLEEDENNQAQEIRAVLKDLVEKSQKAGFDAPVSYEVMLEYLRVPLAQKEQPSHFMTGNVSFCTLLPMRSIPFKVVCLLGMNDQDFPRPNKPLSFDLIAKKPIRGDRSRRQNDRYLFLESLLSARESFYISYVGQSQHDNTIMPPSVLVSELLDYVGKAFSHPQQKILNLIMTHHPLQAFSPRYFNQSDKQLFSFSHEYCRASAVLLNERQTSKNFFETPLPAPQTEWKTVELNQFTRFFKNPIEFLLKERLGIALERGESQIDESEPFEVQGLERYNLNQMLVEKNLEGVDLQEYQAIVKAGGQLPHGEIGDYVYSQLTTQVQPFVDRVKLILHQHKIESVPVNLTIGEMRITGHLGQLWRDSLVHYRCAKLKARDYVQLWIHHLILNSLSQKNLPSYSVLIGENEAWEFQPVKNSLEILQILLNDYYWQGVVQPLSFFPDSSFTFVENLNKGKTEEEAFSRAKNSWRGNDFMRGEAEGDYYQLCFGNDELPLDNEEFKPLAKQFFEPFFEFRQPLSA
ncbi:exodeoxyribonuclease V subunit gamma [Candidatus Marithioploca araucensis]|uniref:RecBCD enzyme subunit RecC n=1 Tax=Candidatus Marithioploca araucensis TaxID=70273 RepID=A0ABT7VQU6_9GAMM|nr:exodeoxyribonuclease V subunit gamma [Candidatus Marithioploca araucensis]